MPMVRIKLTGMLVASALALGGVIAGAVPAAAAGTYTCSGGSPSSPTVIPAGSYKSMIITGFCAPANGSVIIQHDLTVADGAAFSSMNASSKVTIGGNVYLHKGALFALGCGPSFDTPCPEGSSVASSDTIGRNLDADRATLVVLHYDTIGGNARVGGGGGGLSCQSLPGLQTPPYVDFASNVIGGNASVRDLRTCWSGFSNNTVGGNVFYKDNTTGTSDGNFVGGNSIARNLTCFDNSPRPHLSDVTPVPNNVGGHTEGQCESEV